MTENSVAKPRRSSGITNWLLIGLVVVLAAFPLAIRPDSEFGGADDQASEVIAEISPESRPWFSSIWTPPGSETQSLLFALQAGLGGGFIGYYFGRKGRTKSA